MTEIEQLRLWLRATTECEWHNECAFDHHGSCQVHGHDSPCPIPAIRDYFTSICPHVGGLSDVIVGRENRKRCLDCGLVLRNSWDDACTCSAGADARFPAQHATSCPRYTRDDNQTGDNA